MTDSNTGVQYASIHFTSGRILNLLIERYGMVNGEYYFNCKNKKDLYFVPVAAIEYLHVWESKQNKLETTTDLESKVERLETALKQCLHESGAAYAEIPIRRIVENALDLKHEANDE